MLVCEKGGILCPCFLGLCRTERTRNSNVEDMGNRSQRMGDIEGASHDSEYMFHAAGPDCTLRD